jgi:diaminopimelate decarboxylase
MLNKRIEESARELKNETPLFLYDEISLLEHIKKMQSYSSPFGLTVRYAMKANPNLSLLRFFHNHNIWIDASTPNECYRAMAAGIPADHILLTSQEVPSEETLKDLVKEGIEYNACSLLQLKNYAKSFPNTEISIRFNTGRGSSYRKNTSTGGKGSSFGIYGKREKIKEILEANDLTLKRVHIHIGSGAYIDAQQESIYDAIEILKEFPSAKILNMGGGFKVARMPGEQETNIVELSTPGNELLSDFCKESGRQINMEIEPGTALIANAAYIVASVTDAVDTGNDKDSMSFVKTNTGMTMNTRITMYGSQHPIEIIKQSSSGGEDIKCVVVGECCESSDILTCLPGKPAEMREVELNNPQIGDLIIVGGAGAYCSGMSLINYNSKQQAAEYFAREDGSIIQIRNKQKLKDVWKDDILVDLK